MRSISTMTEMNRHFIHDVFGNQRIKLECALWVPRLLTVDRNNIELERVGRILTPSKHDVHDVVKVRRTCMTYRYGIAVNSFTGDRMRLNFVTL